MDDRTFDGLTRMVAEAAPTRRGVLRGLGGGVIAALLAWGGVEEAGAACVKLGNVCKKQGKKLKCCGGAKCQGPRCKCSGGKVACKGKCIPKSGCCTNDDCPSPRLCVKGRCVVGQGTCPHGENVCIDPTFTCGSIIQDCYCFQTTGGETRCGGDNLSQNCVNYSQCIDRHPDVPGVFCVLVGAGGCGSYGPVNFCMRPCPRSD